MKMYRVIIVNYWKILYGIWWEFIVEGIEKCILKWVWIGCEYVKCDWRYKRVVLRNLWCDIWGWGDGGLYVKVIGKSKGNI